MIHELLQAIRFKPDVRIDEEQVFAPRDGRTPVAPDTISVIAAGLPGPHMERWKFPRAKIPANRPPRNCHHDDFKAVENGLFAQRLKIPFKPLPVVMADTNDADDRFHFRLILCASKNQHSKQIARRNNRETTGRILAQPRFLPRLPCDR